MDGFYNRIICASGEEILIAGMCKKGTGRTNFEKCSAFINLAFSKNDDAYDVDYKLAEKINSTLDEYAYAVGASVKVEHITHQSTGGVIGAPKEPAKSADGDIEYIGNGLYLLSLPEGPGVAAECEKEIMDDICLIIKNNKASKLECSLKIIKYLNKCNIKNYLIVNDGSGEDNAAYVLCKAGDVYELPSDV
ncbi:MAG: hypothetical protein AAGU14_07465 [Eubacteriaceae bacterium]